MKNERRFADSFYNPITFLGVFISLLVFLVEVFLFALDIFSAGSNLYLGLITYLVFPGILLFGLLLIPIGFIWKRRKIRRGDPSDVHTPIRLDLSIGYHRRALLVFLIGSAILVPMSLTGSYEAYHYTESVEFCGTLCHQVMHPEFKTYQHSPHGKVQCVECHIGPGAGWFVKSKASGLRQVWHVMLGDYSRPIKVPVSNLRPAQDTCLHCHWAGKSFGTKLLSKSYYLAEQDDRKWITRMDMHLGNPGGIHSHMNLDHEIFYAAEDEQRQKITWVKSVAKDGTEIVYSTKNSIFKGSPPPDQIRKMDCIDCHNRPSHRFLPPDRLLNEAMERGRISLDLPEIKEQGVKLLGKQYASSEEAQSTIPTALTSFYQQKHSEFYAANKDKVDQAAATLQDLFSNNMFPEMKARWESFPDNIGHLNSPGCFRCHDGKHRSESGKAVTRDCNTCHTIIAQGFEDKPEKNLDGLEYKHPDGEEDWKTSPCVECHSGGL